MELPNPYSSIIQLGEGGGETVPAAIPRRRGLDDGGDLRARRGPLDGRVHERHRLQDEDRRGHRGQRHVKLSSSHVNLICFVNEFHTEHLSEKKGRSTARSFNFRPFLHPPPTFDAFPFLPSRRVKVLITLLSRLTISTRIYDIRIFPLEISPTSFPHSAKRRIKGKRLGRSAL